MGLYRPPRVKPNHTARFITFCKDLKAILRKHQIKQLSGCLNCVNGEKLFASFPKESDSVYRTFRVITYGGYDYPKEFNIKFTEQLTFDLNKEPFNKTEQQEKNTAAYVAFLKDFQLVCIKHKVWSIYSTGSEREFLSINFGWSKDGVVRRYIRFKPRSNNVKRTTLYYYEELELGMKKV